jgi:hypothetical protein
LIVSDNLSSRALRRRPTDELRVARISSRLCVEQQTIHSNGATSFLSVVIRKPTVIFHPLGLQTIDTLPGGLRTHRPRRTSLFAESFVGLGITGNLDW